MNYISKAQRQLDGDLLLKADTQALLYRTLSEVRQHLASHPDCTDACSRAVAALQQALGAYPGEVPSVNDLLGNPHRERIARNLLKG
jgi:hypothetical protein